MSADEHRAGGNARGFTLAELLVAGVVLLVVFLAITVTYLFARRSFDYASTEAFLQRHGTLIAETLTGEIVRASALQIASCHAGSASIAVGESVMYRRSVDVAGDFTDTAWCVYREEASAGVPSLWKCPIAALSPGQVCAQPAQDLMAGMPAPPAGLRIVVVPVKDQDRTAQPVFSASPIGGAATSVAVRFALDLRDVSTDRSVISGERGFAFNITLRN
jgi:hypothetical protein